VNIIPLDLPAVPSEKNRPELRGKETCGIDRRRTRPTDLSNNEAILVSERKTMLRSGEPALGICRDASGPRLGTLDPI
jgi:hypothetical protein